MMLDQNESTKEDKERSDEFSGKLAGRTIGSIDARAINVIHITLDNGDRVSISADVTTGYNIPYLRIGPTSEWE